jgi:hypothetical protein
MKHLWFFLTLVPLTIFGQSTVLVDSLYKEQCDVYYSIVEVMPQFPGGDTELLRRVSGFLDAKTCPHRKTTLHYVIDRNGRPTDMKVDGVSDNCTRHFIQEFNKLPDWTPGFQEGVPVCVELFMPLIIELK